jgi:hypothetical protein
MRTGIAISQFEMIVMGFGDGIRQKHIEAVTSPEISEISKICGGETESASVPTGKLS